MAPLINDEMEGGGKGESTRKGYFLRSSSPRDFEYSCGAARRGVEMGVYVFVCLCGRRVLCGKAVTRTDASSRACGSPVTILLGQR